MKIRRLDYWGIADNRLGFAKSGGEILRYSSHQTAAEAALQWNTAHGFDQGICWRPRPVYWDRVECRCVYRGPRGFVEAH